MTSINAAGPRLRSGIKSLLTHTATLWVVFIAVQLRLIGSNLHEGLTVLGDVSWVYSRWVGFGVDYDYWPLVDTPWVYPAVALVPMIIPAVFPKLLGLVSLGDPSVSDYSYNWLVMVVILNAIAFAFWLHWTSDGKRSGRVRIAGAWFWVVFLWAMGPVGIGRIDTVSTALAIIAIVLIVSKPAIASVLLTLGAWIKIWPGVILAAAALAFTARIRIIVAAVVTTAVVVLTVVLLGGGQYLFSFLSSQTTRGLQVEAPVSNIWLWFAYLGIGDSRAYYDKDILSYQISGAGADLASSAMTPIMVVVVAAIAVFGVLAFRRLTDKSDTFLLFSRVSVALVLTLIVVNKVGSAQFIGWLAVPILLGLAAEGRKFLVPGIVAVAAAYLTQWIYPYHYDDMLGLNVVAISVITVRNLLTVGLFVYALWQLGRLALGKRPTLPVEAVTV